MPSGPVEFNVRLSCQAYNAQCLGWRASSTSSAQDAALRLAGKVFGGRTVLLEQLPGDDHAVSRWRATPA